METRADALRLAQEPQSSETELVVSLYDPEYEAAERVRADLLTKKASLRGRRVLPSREAP